MEIVDLRDFNKYFANRLEQDFADGTCGIRLRIEAIYSALMHLEEVVLSMHRDCNRQSESLPTLDNILAVVSAIMEDSKSVALIDFKFVESFLKLTKDRLEFLFSSFICISQFLDKTHRS
jgi:hypothetical protein